MSATGVGRFAATGLREKVIATAAGRLAAAGVPNPRVDAALLVAHVLGTTTAAPDRGGDRADAELSDEAQGRLERLLDARERRIPLQHLVGEAPFRELVLRCRAGVLIPRPETEVVAGVAIARLRAGARAREGRPPAPDAAAPLVVEPGTGTGAIALSLAVEVPGVRVLATDIDPRAVALAQENLVLVAAGDAGPSGLAAGSEVTIERGDLLAPVDDGLRGRVAMLVSNPPYLSADELQRCEPEVREHDPVGALVGGAGGHEIVDRLIAAAGEWLAPGGSLVLEISEFRAADAADGARAAGLLGVEVLPDLTGRDRVMVARRPR